MKNNLFLLALATLLLVSCNKDKGNHSEQDDNVVQITASIDGSADGGTVSAGRATVDNDGEGTFDPGDTWGLYTYTTKGDYMNANTEYKYEETILSWEELSETEPVTFSAHYPRITEEIADPAAYPYMPEAWNNTDDLLHATATASKGGTVALTFKHLMHRLVVNLTAGDGMEGVDLSSALINSTTKDNAPTMFARVEVNLLTGAVNYDRVSAAVMLSNGGGTGADWKVAPQDLTAGTEWLRITVGEDVWYYHVPADLNSSNPDHPTRLESGKRLTLNLTLKKNPDTGNTEVELTGSDISGWDTQPPITDEVVIGGTSGITTYEALLEALQTGGTSTDAPTLITLGADITVPAGGDYDTPPINGSGHFKIDGGGHTLTWEITANNYHRLGNTSPDADAVHIELTNINLDRQDMNSAVCVYNGKITLGKDVTLSGQLGNMILANDEKAALELGDGCELSYAAGSSQCCASVWYGATLVLNGGKTATGAYIELSSPFYPAVSHPLVSVPKALTGDVNLLLGMTGETPVAQGIGGYQLMQTDCDRLIVNPESEVTLYIGQRDKYGDDFELHLDPADNQIKVRLKNFTPPTSGTIDVTGMTDVVAQITIRAALAAGYTEIKLTGELSKIGMGGQWGTFADNTKITKCDLSGVTGWGTTATLPDRAFKDCTALQEVTLPDGVQVIGEYAFVRCAALTTVNLPQVTRIDEGAFLGCTSLKTLTLDNVTAIGLDAFYGCTGLETLKIPKCTRFGNYIVTGCKALTRIETTATGDFVHIDTDNSIENYGVFHNRSTHSGENAFDPTKCALVLNPDKYEGGGAVPTASANNEWTAAQTGGLMRWMSITPR